MFVVVVIAVWLGVFVAVVGSVVAVWIFFVVVWLFSSGCCCLLVVVVRLLLSTSCCCLLVVVVRLLLSSCCCPVDVVRLLLSGCCRPIVVARLLRFYNSILFGWLLFRWLFCIIVVVRFRERRGIVDRFIVVTVVVCCCFIVDWSLFSFCLLLGPVVCLVDCCLVCWLLLLLLSSLKWLLFVFRFVVVDVVDVVAWLVGGGGRFVVSI
jgi:hypothetical protein